MWPLDRSSPRRAVHDRIAPTLRAASLENPSTSISNPAAWLGEALGGGTSFAGTTVSETSAMRSTAVFRCVALKSGVIASLPLQVFERTKQGREMANDHPVATLLQGDPNDLMSAFIWKEFVVSNLMLAGNHLSVFEYNNAARVIGILPVPWQQVEVDRVKGRNRYTVRFNDGREVLDQGDVLHVPGIGFDGIKGISPIQWAGRQPIGTAFALEEFVGRMHANSARPSGFMEVPKGISDNALSMLRAEFAAMAQGLRNSGTVIPVDAGSKFTPMQLTLADAQTLESRRFQVADIARLFGVPPHMIGETDKTSSWGSGVEQQTIGFQIYNLEPELSRIEGELNRKLFTAPYYCEFNREALAAMDAKTLMELYASAVNNAGMTPNEIRRKRNLPDLPGGDDLYIQGATVPLRLAGQNKNATQP
jgi:HK97 family phage portal protein